MDKPKFPYEKIGEVYICRDSANVIIQVENMGLQQERFLITPEFVELMKPTQSCFQLGLQKELERYYAATTAAKVSLDKHFRTKQQGAKPPYSFGDKCARCGHKRGDHQADTRCCPMGTKHRTVGFTCYNPGQTFSPKSKHGKKA